jgi:hypothetical protein
MSRLILALVFAASCAMAQMPPSSTSAEKSGTPDLRPGIYELAGVLGNKGFKVRDGAWAGSLQGAKPQRLGVNLFAGNQYWFCAATSAPGETPNLTLRDPSGQPAVMARFDKDGIAAAGVTAAATGRYILEIKGSSPGTREFCLLYLYK